MQTRVRRFFDQSVPDDERLEQLDEALETFVIYGDTELMLKAYNDWKLSNRVRFPFEGGRFDQPLWVLHDLDTLTLLDEQAELARKLEMVGGDEGDGMKALEF